MFTALFLAAAVAIFYRQLQAMPGRAAKSVMPQKKLSPRLAQQIDYANRLFSERKYLTAEKAYLEVLKHDHKNASAYTRLGLIYTRLKNFADAIECFEIASQLEPSGGSYTNLGLVYFENKNHIKAIAAFEKAIMFEPTAERFISLAKTYQKMANYTKVAESLEKAVAKEPTKEHWWLLGEAYRLIRNRPKAEEAYRQVLQLDPTNLKAKRALSGQTIQA